MPKNGKKIFCLVLVALVAGTSGFFYYWWNTYLIKQGDAPDKPINQFEDTSIENNYYPRPVRPSHLYTINTSVLPGELQVTMLTLAGVLAKGPAGPQIYVEDNGGWYSKWISLIKEENISITPVSDPWQLVKDLGVGNISGYIIYKADKGGVQNTNDPILGADTLTYKHQDESYSVAVSLAGILNATVIDEADIDNAKAAGLTEVFDARGKNNDWLFASDYFKNQMRKDMIFEVEHHTSRRYLLIDYAVFCGAPVWHAQTHDKRAEYLKYFEADSPSFGWGAVGPADEAGLNLQVTVAGGFFMPSDWARDISVFAAIPVETKQKELPTLPEENNVHYVTIVMSDGDNLQWAMGGLGDQKFFGNPNRGKFAMGWTIPPAMADLTPLILRHYYREASDKDRFVAGVSGHGLIYNSKHPWQELHVNRSGPILARADTPVITIQDFGWQKETFEYSARLPEVDGVIYIDYRQYAMQTGKSMWVHDKPCLSFTYNFWIGYDSAPGIALSVNTASRSVHSPYAYSMIVVHAWSHGMDDVYDLVQRFGDHVRVVDPETFIALYSQNVPKVDAYALSIMQVITLYGQYILIGLGIGFVILLSKKMIKKIRKPKVPVNPESKGQSD